MAKYNYDKKALRGLTPFPFLGEVKTRTAAIEAAVSVAGLTAVVVILIAAAVLAAITLVAAEGYIIRSDCIGVDLVAVLVCIVVVLEIALHQDHFALGEPLADKFGCLAPAGDINEIRLTLFALLDEVAVNRNRDTAHRNAALRGAHLRISCQSAHQEYLVQHSLYLPCSVHGNAEKSGSVSLREHLPRVCALLTWS